MTRQWIILLLLLVGGGASFAGPGVFQVFSTDASQFVDGEKNIQGVGTASLIDRKSGLFLTAAHVVMDACAGAGNGPVGTSNIYIRLSVADKAIYIQVTNVYSGFAAQGKDSDHDFALLQLADPSQAELFDSWDEIKLSEISLKIACDMYYSYSSFLPITVMGFPSGKKDLITESAKFASSSAIGKRRWQLNIPVFGGESGGPCIVRAELAGIVIQKEENPYGDDMSKKYSQVLSVADILSELTSHLNDSARVDALLLTFKSGKATGQEAMVLNRLLSLNAIELMQLIEGLRGQKHDDVKVLAQYIGEKPYGAISMNLFYDYFPQYRSQNIAQSLKTVEKTMMSLNREQTVSPDEIFLAYVQTSAIVDMRTNLEASLADKTVLAQAIGDYVYLKRQILKVKSDYADEGDLLQYAARLDGENPSVLRAFAVSPTTPPFDRPYFMAVAAQKIAASAEGHAPNASEGALPSGLVKDWIQLDGRNNTYDTASQKILCAGYSDKASSKVADTFLKKDHLNLQ